MRKCWLAGIAMGLASAVAVCAQTVAPVAPVVTVTPKANDDWAQLGRYAAANAQLAPVEGGRVVFYGDSITDGWKLESFFPDKPYVNRGISGQTTPQMLVRFRQDVVKLKPEVVVILAGTNDIAGNTGPMTQEMTADNFRSMVELARANGIRVVLASVLPAAKFSWRPAKMPAADIAALNDWLKAYCAEQKLVYLDYYSAMVGEDGGMKPGLSKDGVHPNAAGYAIMQPLAQAAVDAAMKR